MIILLLSETFNIAYTFTAHFTRNITTNCSNPCGVGLIQLTTVKCSGTTESNFKCTERIKTEVCTGPSCQSSKLHASLIA